MKKILVLEDEPNIRSFVVINLRRNGYEPIEAENGMAALSQLEKNPDISLSKQKTVCRHFPSLRKIRI